MVRIAEMSSVVTPASFSVSKISFSAVKSLESGGKQAYLNYNSQPLVLQVGPLQTPFGMSVFDKGGPPKYSVDVNLRGYDDPANNPTTAALYNLLQSLDDFMLDQGVKNATSWFKGVKSREVLSELYTPTVKFAKDQAGNVKPYPPTIKLQLRQRNGKFETNVYDDQKRPLTDVPLEDVLVKGTILTALIQCTGVWFAGGKFGISWKAIQILADKVPQRLSNYAFVDEDKEDSQTKTSFANLHEEEDDDEALESKVDPPPVEEDEEAPVPVPPKSLKMTAKKVVKTLPLKK